MAQYYPLTNDKSAKPLMYCEQMIFSNYVNHGLIFLSGYAYNKALQFRNERKKDGSIDYTYEERYRIRSPLTGYINDFKISRNKINMPYNLRYKSIKIPDTDLYSINIYPTRAPGLNNDFGFIFFVPLKEVLPPNKEEWNNYATALEGSNCGYYYNKIIERIKKSKFVMHEIYKLLKEKSFVPILEEWIEKLFEKEVLTIRLNYAYYANLDNPNNIFSFEFFFSDDRLVNTISRLLKNKEISINGSNEASQVMKSTNTLTEYLSHFSNQLIDKASNKFTAIYDPAKDKFTQREKDYFDYTEYASGLNFFNAQKYTISAVSRSLNCTNSAIIVGEMGSGKTSLAIGSVFLNSADNNSNTIVMAPGHLVEKWKREIERLYPGAKAIIIDDFNTVLDIEKEVKDKSRNYPIFLIISKDTAKISYMERPSVIYNKYNHRFYCPYCGAEQYYKNRSNYYNAYENNNQGRRVSVLEQARIFMSQNNQNNICSASHKNTYNKRGYQRYTCGHKMWTSTNTNEDTKWIRITGFGYLNTDMIDDIISEYDSLSPNFKANSKNAPIFKKIYDTAVKIRDFGVPKVISPRRYSIARYIREKLKGCIDYFIADEVHLYSSSTSAQANAFGDFVSVAKKTIALTGTLLNGYSNGIYYILYRMYPKAFRAKGFNYNQVQDFVERYGVHRISTYIADDGYRIIKKVKKTLPGVSPKLFTEFLLDKAIFISLSDMSNALPDYKEIPIGIDMDEASRDGYNSAIQQVRTILENNDNNGRAVSFIVSQKLNTYPDEPFNVAPVFDKNKKPVVVFEDAYNEKEQDSFVSNKDFKTLELVQKHIARGENVLIYVNYVNKTECVDRLEALLTLNNIKTCVLDNKVAAKNREEWIDKKVKDGYRVMICNPSLVETGLDLLAFTTIIFYQIGYNLFTMRQASRRSLRLNQPNNVTVYFMYYKDTTQEAVLSLMANKLQAAMAIEGKFTEEGLNAMSNNDDILTQIASSIVQDIKYKVEEGSFSSGIGTPEDDGGTRFQLIDMITRRTKPEFYSIWNGKEKTKVKYSVFSLAG